MSLPPPPRWEGCPRHGSIIARTFIPFKTPLDSTHNVPEVHAFQPSMMPCIVKQQNMEMGLVIDLTNTTRFYKSVQFESKNIKYMKLECKGHGECPPKSVVERFIIICRIFKAKNPNKIIGVHCTHGFNRTGFLIIAYLVEVFDWSVEAAFNEFLGARSPGIYKQHYIVELFQRFGTEDAIIPTAPSLPNWHIESQDDEIGAFDPTPTPNPIPIPIANGFDGSSRIIPGKAFIDTMDIPLVKQVLNKDTVHGIQLKVRGMCDFTRNMGFCGAQPVSMTQENFKLLAQKPYMVSWKADGNRFLMLIDGKDRVFMLDRDNTVFHVQNLEFPTRKKWDEHIQNTLVDGELIIDIVDGRKIPRFLIYDIVKFQNIKVGTCDFKRRLMCISLELVGPRNEKTRQGRLDKSEEPFSIRKKDFFELTVAGDLLDEKFQAQVKHETDGLIFQPCGVEPTDQYRAGRNDDMLKWKPGSLNSVDYKLVLKKDSGVGILTKTRGFLYVGQLKEPFAELSHVTKEIRKFDGKIIECVYIDGKWKMIRERTDKSYPNSFNTAKSVCGSIQRPVTQEFLLDFICRNRYIPPKRAPTQKPRSQESVHHQQHDGHHQQHAGHHQQQAGRHQQHAGRHQQQAGRHQQHAAHHQQHAAHHQHQAGRHHQQHDGQHQQHDGQHQQHDVQHQQQHDDQHQQHSGQHGDQHHQHGDQHHQHGGQHHQHLDQHHQHGRQDQQPRKRTHDQAMMSPPSQPKTKK